MVKSLTIFFDSSKFLPIYLCIKIFYIKLQNRLRIDGNSINSNNVLCRRYGDTFHHLSDLLKTF